MDGRTLVGYRLGVAGSLLGIAAGIVQWALGAEIPEWTGDKLHPEQLGIITIVLSLLALASVRYVASTPRLPPRSRWWLVLGILVPAGICFTTVGRLWYVPGPLLIAAAVLLVLGPERR